MSVWFLETRSERAWPELGGDVMQGGAAEFVVGFRFSEFVTGDAAEILKQNLASPRLFLADRGAVAPSAGVVRKAAMSAERRRVCGSSGGPSTWGIVAWFRNDSGSSSQW